MLGRQILVSLKWMLVRVSVPWRLVTYASLVVSPDGHVLWSLFRQAYLEIEGYLLLEYYKSYLILVSARRRRPRIKKIIKTG